MAPDRVSEDQEKNMATAEVISMPNTARPGAARIVHDRSRRSVEDLRHGLRAAGARPARRQSAHPAQRVCRHHGAVGIGQIDADEPDRLPRHAFARQVLAEQPAGQRTRRRRTGAHPQQRNRIRLPDLQPAGPRHRSAQRRTAADLCRHSDRRTHGARQRRHWRRWAWKPA